MRGGLMRSSNKRSSVIGFTMISFLVCCTIARGQETSNLQAPLTFGEGGRVALLIGQSDYRGAPLPSASADVSMIARQLTDAGFDVDSKGDLPDQAISEYVSALVDKITLKGRNATVFVYVSGRFAQINGENILLPVGVPIERASEVTLRGFSVRKLLNALESVPAKTKIVVLDASPAPPDLAKEAAFSPGLAVVDPPEGFLVTYSQGPNRHLVEPTSAPGGYSKALVEWVNEPVGDLGDMFKHVRLRMHNETSGLQIPWESNKLTSGDFAFYASNAPSVRSLSASVSTVAEVKLLPREEAYKQVVASDSINSYQSFIQAYPDDDAVPTMQYNLAVRREAEIWSRATRSNSPNAYWTYIQTYPDGGNVAVARDRIAALGHSPAPPAGFAPSVFMDLPPPLAGREIVASSASMPLEVAPRAPRMSMPAAPAIVATAAAAAVAAVAVPALMNRGGGRQIPVAPVAAVRPSLAAPSSAPIMRPPSGPGIAASAPAMPVARTVASPVTSPVASAPGARPAMPPVAAPPQAVSPLAAPQNASAVSGSQPGAGRAPGAAAAPSPPPGVRPLGASPQGVSPVSNVPGARPLTPPAVAPLPVQAAAPSVRPLAAPQNASAVSGSQPSAGRAPGAAAAPNPPLGVRPLGASPQSVAPAMMPQPGATRGAMNPPPNAPPLRAISGPSPGQAQQNARPVAPMQALQPQRAAVPQPARPSAPQISRPSSPQPVYRAPVQQPARAAPPRSCRPDKSGKCI
jgi:hypothetical protein